jgi:hypothetical protein
MWRNAIHGKDEALRLIYSFTETLPIARPSEAIRADAETGARRLIELTRANQETTGEVLNWLRVERGIESPGQRLVDLASLDAGGFVAEVKKRSPKTNPLRPSALRLVQETYAAYVPPMIARRAEIQALERGLSDLVNQAYGLTPEEIALMWRTAPPRMPIPGPVPSQGKV